MQWATFGESKSREYTYSYDDLSRLISGNYLENGTSSTNYSTSYVYDKVGNITSLIRHGATGTTTFGTIDNLTMSYNGNQLIKADDSGESVSLSSSMDFKDGANASVEYFYDANGNLTKDLNKGITNISYNLLNLPRALSISNSFGSGTNTYLYSADGGKLRVLQQGVSSTKQTDYCGNMIYENGTLKRILVDGGYIEGGTYYYYLTDHQGNTRVVANAGGSVVQTNHYYPFGMSFTEGNATSNQPYKYNGKELDTERGLNWCDYGARMYDPALGRWHVADPLAEKYYSISPYAYCAGNPVNRIDIMGDSISAEQQKSQQMITNTLTTEDAQYVQFNEDGDINMDLLLSHSSDSGNYNDLVAMATSDLWTLVSLDDQYTYKDNAGNSQPSEKMSYISYDKDFVDSNGNTPNGTTTGENGFMGKTLLPGTGLSGQNSPDGNVHVIINKHLSTAAQAEMYSHEANGHGLMYVNTRDRVKSGHIYKGLTDANKQLIQMIIRSKMETVENMRVK